jgi:NAD(P)-dependent dehydrogenase (short-subunit alcohol dehydrogenase family)
MPGPDTGTLAGRVAIVTGAGQGGGRGAALALAARGVKLVLFGRTAAKLEALADEVGQRGSEAIVVTGDVGDGDDRARLVAEAIARFGTVHILVNTAQSPEQREQTILGADPEVTEALWRTGFIATHELMRLCHPHMRDAGGGSIVNFGTGSQHHPAGFGIYSAVKSAITTMSRAAAIEWGKDNVRVNVVLPYVQSPAQAAHAKADPAMIKIVEARIPLGRVGDPELDVGRPVAFLAGPESSYITGTVLALNGGGSFVH